MSVGKLFFLVFLLLLIFQVGDVPIYASEQAYTINLLTNRSVANPGEQIEVYVEIVGVGNFNGCVTIMSDQNNLVSESAFVKVYRLIEGELVFDSNKTSKQKGFGAIISLQINSTRDENVFRRIYMFAVIDTKNGRTTEGEHIITASLIGSHNNSRFVYEKSGTFKVNTTWEMNPWLSSVISYIVSCIIGAAAGYIAGSRRSKKFRNK